MTTPCSFASARANRTQRTTWPYPSWGPASTTMPISALLCKLLTSPRDGFLPRFQHGFDFVLENVADAHPVSLLLRGDQLRQGSFQDGRKFLARNFCIQRVGPSEIF